MYYHPTHRRSLEWIHTRYMVHVWERYIWNTATAMLDVIADCTEIRTVGTWVSCMNDWWCHVPSLHSLQHPACIPPSNTIHNARNMESVAIDSHSEYGCDYMIGTRSRTYGWARSKPSVQITGTGQVTICNNAYIRKGGLEAMRDYGNRGNGNGNGYGNGNGNGNGNVSWVL